MKSINDNHEYDLIIRRISHLTPATKSLWGKMDVNEMICHQSDPLRDIMGIRITEPVVPKEMQPKIYEMVMTEEDWAHDLPTFPPYLQAAEGGGTKPTTFDQDKKALLDLLTKYHTLAPDFQFHPHAGLGVLTKDQFGMFFWKHIDHHLRQFGV